jgi:archaemetzincin
VLAVAAVGSAPGEVLSAMEAALGDAFVLPVRRVGAIAEPAAFSAQRGQWSSTAFLETLLPLVPRAATRLLGVTERDLFVPVLSFVYGQAQLGEGRRRLPSRACGPSSTAFPRRPRSSRAARRPRPCTRWGTRSGSCTARPRCPMSLSIDLPDLDGKTATPCPACRVMIDGSRAMRVARARAEGERR